MNILEKIVVQKRLFVEKQKGIVPFSSLEKSPLFPLERPSFFDSLIKKGPSVITEFKRKSPSKGDIHSNAKIASIIKDYSSSGASAISVLTDVHFGGELKDLKESASISDIPLLRKDFIVDEYQIYEAKSNGASAILLIAAVLLKDEISKFTQIAHSLSLDVLLEIHDEKEIGKIGSNNNIVGINSRNLKSFNVDIESAIHLLEKLDKEVVKVGESGIQNVEMASEMYRSGFDAFLIGELFMRSENPGSEAEKFIRELNKSIDYED